MTLFELLVVETEEYPQVCWGVTGSDLPGAELHFSTLSLSTGLSTSSPSGKGGAWRGQEAGRRRVGQGAPPLGLPAPNLPQGQPPLLLSSLDVVRKSSE